MGHPAHISLTDRLRDIESEIAAGRAESALPRCQEIATLYPRALAVQRVLGEIYLALRKPREALATLDRTLTGDPEDARACCARAIVHQMHGDQLAALAWYRRACDIRPEDATLRATYREMASRLGQPPYQPGRVGLARLYLRGDLFTHAIREWETLVAENSDSTRLEAHVGLVETLWRAGRAQEAEAWARRTLTNAPSCLKPLLIAAVVAHDEGRDADAEPFLRRAADLDPDHRAARALFADRLSAGDTALSALIWGETPPFDPSTSGGAAPGAPWTRPSQGPAPAPQGLPPTSQGPTPASGQRVTQPAARRVNRPLVTGELAMPAPRTRPDLTAPPSAPLPPPMARPNDLPPGFHSMFKETEGMLWNPGDSDPDALRDTITTSAAPAAPFVAPMPQPAPFSTPAQPPLGAVAPAIAEGGFALGDTEMRRAIRWVQWLQAQGARSLGDEPQRAHPSGTLDTLLNNPPAASQSAAPSQSFGSAPLLTPPVTALPSMPSQPSGALPSGALPPPSSADLRQMFAELDPGARGRREAGAMESGAAPLDAPYETAASAAGASAEWSMSLAEALNQFDDNIRPETSRVTGSPAAHVESIEKLATGPMAPPSVPTEPAGPVEPAAPDAPAGPAPDAIIEELVTGPMAPADAPAEPSKPAEPARSAGPTPDATIEDLERQGMADGFMPFTLEPGALAAMTGEAAPEREEDRGDDWLDTRASEPPTAPEPLAAEPLVMPAPETPAAEPLVMPAPETPAAEPFVMPAPETPMSRAAETPTGPEPPAETSEMPEEPLLTPQPEAPDAHDYAARLAQARGHRDSGALDEAIVEYRTVVRNAPELLPDVLADVESCLAERPEHPELHRLLGDARIRQGDYLGALESYNRAVALSQSLDA